MVFHITARAGVLLQAGADPAITNNTIHSCLAISSHFRKNSSGQESAGAQPSSLSSARHNNPRSAGGSPKDRTSSTPRQSENSTSFATTDTNTNFSETKKKTDSANAPTQSEILHNGGIGVLCEEYCFGTIMKNNISACQRCNVLIGTPSRVVYTPSDSECSGSSNVVMIDMTLLRDIANNSSTSMQGDPKSKQPEELELL